MGVNIQGTFTRVSLVDCGRFTLFTDFRSWLFGVTVHRSPSRGDPLGQRHAFEVHFGPLHFAATWDRA